MKKKISCRWLAMLMAVVMLMGVLSGCVKDDPQGATPPVSSTPDQNPPAYTGEPRWSETKTADGWMKVTNEGGKTLGYWPGSGIALLEAEGWAFKDLNQNGKLDPYEDWRLDYNTRAEDLAKLMTGEDQAKILMFLSMSGVETPTSIGDAMMAELDRGCRTYSVRASTVEDTVKTVNMLQSYVESLPFGVPVDLRGDRGNSLASQWPRHLALAATFDPEVAAEYNRLYSSELRDLGLTTLHHPQMDIASEPRWYRFVDTFGEHPQIVEDFGLASTNALQSTYDETGKDIGWGDDSTNALIKHFPGDGAGEGGRESHAAHGKFNVFPGGNFETHVGIYEASLNHLPGLTGSAAGVMTNFSVSIDADGTPIGGEAVGTAYSEYKTTGLLRDRFGWDGIICTDYSIMTGMSWGMETISEPERLVKALEAGDDRIEAYNNFDNAMEGFGLYAEKYGKSVADARVADSTRRLIRSFMQVGLFENPYLELAESKANVASADKVAAGYNVMVKSVIMLKNSSDIISAAGSGKQTVYIPMKNNGEPCISMDIAEEYFNVVTDTLNGEKVVRASAADIAACDFALVAVNSPANLNPDPEATRWNQRAGWNSLTNEYIPVSLQYRPYTANSQFVRQESIGGDMIESDNTELFKDDYYGQKGMLVKENRSYYGNSAYVTNESDLDLILYAADVCDKVVVVVNATHPLIVNEFESKIDGLIMQFGVDMRAVLDIVSGKTEPSALLPMQLPANMDTVEAQYEDVPFDMECHVDGDGNTYDFAFGLNWSGVISDARTAKYSK